MDLAEFWQENKELLKPVAEMIERAVPVIGKIAITLFVGLIVTFIIRRTVRWVLEKLNLEALLIRLGLGEILEKFRLKGRLETGISKFVFYLGMAITVYVTAEVSGLTAISSMLGKFVAFLPKLAAAAGITIVGAIASQFAQSVTTKIVSARASFEAPELIGRGVYILIISLALAMAAGQLGFEVTLINSLIVLMFGGIMFGSFLTFALGGQSLLSQMILKYYVTRTFHEGEEVELCGYHGTLSQFGSWVLILHTDDDRRIFIPYEKVMESPIKRIRRGTTLAEEETPAEPEEQPV